MSYVFHCSRCKFAHAGECVTTAAPAVEHRVTVASTTVSRSYPPMPRVGSRWVSQVKQPDGSWRDTRYTFEVTGFDVRLMTVEYCTTTATGKMGPLYNIDVMLWDPDGVDIAGDKVRAVPGSAP